MHSADRLRYWTLESMQEFLVGHGLALSDQDAEDPDFALTGKGEELFEVLQVCRQLGAGIPDEAEVSGSSGPVSSHMGPWIATFTDGPLSDRKHDRFWAAGPVHRDLYLAPNPRGSGRSWVVVGYDGLVPAEPWPGQVHYRFGAIVEMAGVDGEPLVYYQLADD